MQTILIDQHQTTITNYMYLGLLPFFMGALGPWIFADQELWLSNIFLFYSSIILVFLSGTLWGIALFSNIANPLRHIHCAIVFSLIPFAVHFFSPMLNSVALLISFLLFLFWEKCFINSIYPQWYQKLRHQITFIVAGCHMLVIFNLLKI